MHPSVFVGLLYIYIYIYIHLINARDMRHRKVIDPFVPVGGNAQMFIIRFVRARFNLNTSVVKYSLHYIKDL
jgi:hypothetical protein